MGTPKNKKSWGILAYLADIFNYINSVNTNMMGCEKIFKLYR